MLKLFAFAALFAAITGYYFMNKWLSSFAYHIDISFAAFLISLGIVLFLTSSAMVSEIVKAAGKNPVDVIKHE
jgi:putative ABC transport system permease protein